MGREGRLVIYAGLFLFLLFLYFGLRYLLPLVLPFVLGAFLALMLEPCIAFMENRLRLPRAIAAGVAVIGAVTLVTGVVVILATRVVAEVADLSRQLPTYSYGMVKTIQGLIVEAQDFYLGLPQPLFNMVEESIRRLYDLAGIALRGVLGAVGALPNFMVTFILSCLTAYFLSRDRQAFSKALLHFLPPGWVARLRAIEKEMTVSLVGLIWAQAILVVITTLIAIVGLWLLRVRYAVFAGLMSGLLDILPVVGPTLVFLPWIVTDLLTGQFARALGLLTVYLTMNIVRQVLQGKIIGRSVGLHPLAVLVSLYLGVKLLGPNGLIIGPLTLIILKALLKVGAFGNLIK